MSGCMGRAVRRDYAPLKARSWHVLLLDGRSDRLNFRKNTLKLYSKYRASIEVVVEAAVGSVRS